MGRASGRDTAELAPVVAVLVDPGYVLHSPSRGSCVHAHLALLWVRAAASILEPQASTDGSTPRATPRFGDWRGVVTNRDAEIATGPWRARGSFCHRSPGDSLPCQRPSRRAIHDFGHWHRCAGGTSRRTSSTWRPHPIQVGFPHVRHTIRWHISVPPGARRRGRFAGWNQRLRPRVARATRQSTQRTRKAGMTMPAAAMNQATVRTTFSPALRKA